MMPDLEKVIRGLECCNAPNRHEGCPYDGAAHYNICTHHLLTDAIALLREREPVEPKKADAWPTTITLCGACGSQIPTPGGWRYKYCPTCGRGIKWDAAD